MEEKKAIRRQIAALRKAVTDSWVEENSRVITGRVAAMPVFADAKRVMIYIDYNHEVMTGFLIEEAWRAGKQVAVPKVVGKDMDFYLLESFDQLEPGYFGIREPARGEIVHWEQALMFMPGVAFDRQNHRVGYGGGFYDRFLEGHPEVARVALAFDFQVLPQVPTEPTDICPQWIVTEREILKKEDF